MIILSPIFDFHLLTNGVHRHTTSEFTCGLLLSINKFHSIFKGHLLLLINIRPMLIRCII